MCGIVFAGSNSMGMRDVEFFEQLLYCDIIRGDHSTGVFSGFSHLAADPLEIKIRKAAVPADVYLRREDLWGQVKEDRRPSPYNATASIVKQPKFLVGHNRYATMGEIVDANAHPFQHGNITLVHNGTLDNQSLLPDSEKFKVDSENVCYAIDKIGIEETIKKLHGKFTLVWFDAKDQTLNFLRNKDRPFHFIETSTGDWFGASEEDMIMWLSKRSKGPTAKRHFEAEVGTQYVFDVSNGQFRFKEERKHELPVFRYVYSGYQSRGGYPYGDSDADDEWERYYSGNRGHSSQSSVGPLRQSPNRSQTQSGSKASEETQKERLNKLLKEHGVMLKVGENVFFDVFQFDEYPNNSGKGKVTGYLSKQGDYVEVQAPGVNKEHYAEGREFVGRILSCYVMNYCLHLVVGMAKPRDLVTTVDIPANTALTVVNNTATVSEIIQELSLRKSVVDEPLPGEGLPSEPEEVTEEDEDEAVCAVTADGTVVTKKEWESNGALNCCANCSSPIPWAEAEDATIDRGNAFCADCNPNEYEEGDDGYPKDSGSDRDEYSFKCAVCNQKMHTDLESSNRGVCVMCNASMNMRSVMMPEPEPAIKSVTQLPNMPYRRLLKNGMRVTRELWNKMNECWCCKGRIAWEEAEMAGFMNGRTLCRACDVSLSDNKLPKGSPNRPVLSLKR